MPEIGGLPVYRVLRRAMRVNPPQALPTHKVIGMASGLRGPEFGFGAQRNRKPG
jgi:hypothetical protein